MGDVADGVDGARPPPSTASSGRRTSRRRRTRPPLPAKPTDLSTKAAAGIQYQLLQQQNTRDGGFFIALILGIEPFYRIGNQENLSSKSTTPP